MTDLRPTTHSTIGVIAADDDPDIRYALAELLGDHPAFDLLGTAASGRDAAALAAHTDPQLVVVDVQMPQGGAEAIALVNAVVPNAIVAVFTAKRDRATNREMMAAGAAAVFIKGSTLDLASDLAALVDA
jgi:DNA-binding NarL/FixJ family response regulator